MKTIEATIYVVPTPKGRARSRVAGGRVMTYTPAKTRKAEEQIAYDIRRQVTEAGVFDAGVPLSLHATFFLEKPKSCPKRVTLPVKRPDLDNYGKLLCDALNKYAWPDDSQLVDMHIRKRYGIPPRIELKISEVLE